MRKLYFLFIMLAFSYAAYSQKENNIWYFGNQAGLDFNSGTPTALTNGAMSVLDNPASVADPTTGALLFYSNGENVWNANHVVMPNGSGLLGTTSGGTSAFAVKQPGANNNYYLFTTDGFASTNGLRYSVINMNLNGGLGDVTATKNVLLINPSTEKVCVVRHSNNTDVWIVTHPFNSGSFNCYLLSSTGLSTTPVISTVGSAHSGSSYNATGQMTASPSGDKIGCAIYDSQYFELFDFNKSTGTLSNVTTISGYTNPWGVAFSPNGNILYVTQWYGTSVKQFDLSSGNAAIIAASVTTVGNVTGSDPTGYRAGYMQLGPDKKIYVAKFGENNIAVINNPDVLGTGCNFTDIGVLLGSKHAQAGLPTLWNFNYCDTLNYSVAGPFTPCSGTIQSFSISPDTTGNFTWSVPSGWTILSGQGTDSITVLTGSGSGNITATAPSNFCNEVSQSLTVTVSGSIPSQPSAIAGPVLFCENTVQTYSVTNVPGVTYTWEVPAGWSVVSGQGTNSVIVTTAPGGGTISVTPSNLCGDGLPSTLSVSVLSTPVQPVAINGPAMTCTGATNTFSVNSQYGVNYTWTVPSGWVINSGQGTASVIVTPNSTAGMISVVAYNDCDTADVQTLVVTPESGPSVVNQPVNAAACQGSYTSFSVTGNNATSYQWQVNTGSIWTNISAAGTSPTYSGWTTAMLGLSNVPLSSAGWKYRCVILNPCGAVISSFSTLSVNTSSSSTLSDSICKSGYFVMPGGDTVSTSGIHYDTLTNSLGCDSIITVHVSYWDVDVTVTVGTGTLTANASPAIYQWFDCNSNSIIVGEVYQTFTPVDSGHYAVIIMQDECVDTSACIGFYPVGLSSDVTRVPIKVYPSPVGSILHIQLLESDFSEISFFNSSGALVRHFPCNKMRNIEVDVSEMPAGLYNIRYVSNKKTYFSRIIIHH